MTVRGKKLKIGGLPGLLILLSCLLGVFAAQAPSTTNSELRLKTAFSATEIPASDRGENAPVEDHATGHCIQHCGHFHDGALSARVLAEPRREYDRLSGAYACVASQISLEPKTRPPNC